MASSSCIIRNGELYVNSKRVDFPGSKHNYRVSQINEKVYVNGYEYTGDGWKRTLPAIFHYFF